MQVVAFRVHISILEHLYIYFLQKDKISNHQVVSKIKQIKLYSLPEVNFQLVNLFDCEGFKIPRNNTTKVKNKAGSFITEDFLYLVKKFIRKKTFISVFEAQF